MKRVRPLVWTIDPRAIPVHAVTHQTGSDIERIPFIRPPAIYAERENFAVLRPITARLLFHRLLGFARIMDGTAHRARIDYHMQCNLEMIGMELSEDRARIGEYLFVELKLHADHFKVALHV